MVFEVQEHEKYGKSFDTKKSIKPDESMEFTLLFDSPFKGEKMFKNSDGSERPWTWRKYTVHLHTPEEHENISFFAKGQSEVHSKNFGEALEAFKTGDRVKCTKVLYETKRGWFEKWKIEGVVAPGQRGVEEEIAHQAKERFGSDLTKEQLGEKANIKDDPLLDKVWGHYTK